MLKLRAFVFRRFCRPAAGLADALYSFLGQGTFRSPKSWMARCSGACDNVGGPGPNAWGGQIGGSPHGGVGARLEGFIRAPWPREVGGEPPRPATRGAAERTERERKRIGSGLNTLLLFLVRISANTSLPTRETRPRPAGERRKAADRETAMKRPFADLIAR